MRRKLLTIFLALALCLSLMPAAVFADEPAAIARIGDTPYTSLQDAVDTASSDDTITLLEDAIGSGIFLKDVQEKTITIDFDGHTYTVNSLVGSTGTENQGFHLEKGNTVILKNGTIAVDSSLYETMRLMIQNYCNLTIENMTLDGTNCTNMDYVVSNNDSEILIKDSTIKARTVADVYAVDAAIWGTYAGAAVTLENSTVIGTLEIAQWVKEGSPAQWVKNPNYTSPNGRPILTVKGGSFTDLESAIACAEDGATISLAADASGAGIVIDKNITIDLNDNTYTINSLVGDTNPPKLGLQLLKGNNITIKNGSLELDPNLAASYFVKNYANLTIDNVVFGANVNEATINNTGQLTVTGASTSIPTPTGKDWAITAGNYKHGDIITTDIQNGTIGGVAIETPLWETGDATVDESVSISITGGMIDKVGKWDWRPDYAPTYDNAPLLTNTSFVITGGRFYSDPSAYVPDTHSVTVLENIYLVSAIPEPEPEPTPAIVIKTRYDISVSSSKHGTVSANKSSSTSDLVITVTATPDEGAELESISVVDASGAELSLIAGSTNVYRFRMPASDVSVSAVFKLIEEKEPEKIENPFEDVPEDAYYTDAVLWAVENDITQGTTKTTFSPEAKCTRAQAVMFLWNAAGKPASNAELPFTDVQADAYYYGALRWAYETGLIFGTTATTFSPDDVITRAQFVTLLYRLDGGEAVSTANFADVKDDAYYAGAVAWAAENGITHGTGNNMFSPDAECNRAQSVTFIYNQMA